MDKFPKISDYLLPDMVLDLNVTSKDQALEAMLNKILLSPRINNKNKIRNAIFAREQLMSTGIGYGLAVPHARDNTVDDFVIAVARCKNGVIYDSIDDMPVTLIFMIIASDKQDKDYIRLLSRIMLKMKNKSLLHEIMEAESTKQIFKLLQ